MRRILLIGKNGQVGWELQRTLSPLGHITVLDRQGMDLADPDSIRRAVRAARPDWIVNAAAYTAVDKAESESDMAMAINGVAPGILAEEAKRLNALLIHFSTDYVFDGRKTEPYTESDQPNPINIYGKTKLEGERAITAVAGAHLIFRISWVYCARGKNFLMTMLQLAKERDELRIVNDQIGAPSWSRFIAEAVAQVLVARSHRLGAGNEYSGIYHLSVAAKASWYEFAVEIFRNDEVVGNQTTRGLGLSVPRIIPIASTDYPSAVARPANSMMNCTKLVEAYGIFLPDWRDSLALCLMDLTARSS